MKNQIPDGPWTVAQGEYEGRPMIVRINTGAASLVGDERFGHRIGVAVPLHNPTPDGLPTAQEAGVLNDIEDALALALTADGSAVPVVATTTSGMREFVFYTSEPASVDSRLQILHQKVASHELQLVVEEDVRWEVYQQFTDPTGAA